MDNNLLRKIRVSSPFARLPDVFHSPHDATYFADRNGIVWLISSRACICIILSCMHVYVLEKVKKNYSSNFYFSFPLFFLKKKNYSLSYNSFALLFRLLRDLAEGRSLSRVCFFIFEKI